CRNHGRAVPFPTSVPPYALSLRRNTRMQQPINTIIFDLGGVLIDWNPRYLYRKIFRTEEEIEWFLSNICTSEWNDLQDAGRPFEEAIRERIEKFPDHHEPITAWHTRWKETISG